MSHLVPSAAAGSWATASSAGGITGGISITLWDSGGVQVLDNKYVPSSVYTVKIDGGSTAFFRGYSFSVFSGTTAPADMGATKAGSMAIVAGDTNTKANTGCPGTLTHTNGNDKYLAQGKWTAPAATAGGTGTVSRPCPSCCARPFFLHYRCRAVVLLRFLY